MTSKSVRYRLYVVCALAFTVGLIALMACRSAGYSRKSFSQSEVNDVLATLKGVPEANYRMVLPQFEGGAMVGSKTYGTLPVTEVRKLASRNNITFVDTGNLQAIVMDNGGGAGSHTESQSGGQDIGRRIERIVRNIDKSQYTFIR
jgi:hypothetical protein